MIMLVQSNAHIMAISELQLISTIIETETEMLEIVVNFIFQHAITRERLQEKPHLLLCLKKTTVKTTSNKG